MSGLLWRETVRQALLGTGRSDAIAPASDGDSQAVVELVEQGDFVSAEQKLLTQAGLISMHQLIGSTPMLGDGPVRLDAPIQSGNGNLSTLIGSMLDGRFKDLLIELLERAAAQNVALPAEQVPNLLSYAQSSLTARHLVIRCLSPQARAMAALNPRWSFAAPDIAEWDGALREWRAEKPVARQAFLRQMRHLDPDFGRELLQSTWKSEQQHVRLWFIRILRVNLSMRDEPFLESALDDRALGVRKEAIELLSALPESRLCQRMQKSTRHVLTWSRTEQRLVVRFPVGINRLLKRDGVPTEIKSKNQARLRGNQLYAMVSPVPLSVWTERFGVSAETLLSNLTASKWPQTLLRAFTDAALRQENAVWANAVLRREVRPNYAKLVNVLSEHDRDAIFKKYADQHDGAIGKHNALVTLAYHATGQWSEIMVRALLCVLVLHFAAADPDAKSALLSNALRKMVKGCPPEMCQEISDLLLNYEHLPQWRTKVHDLTGLLRYRMDMFAALSET